MVDSRYFEIEGVCHEPPELTEAKRVHRLYWRYMGDLFERAFLFGTEMEKPLPYQEWLVVNGHLPTRHR